MLTFSYANAHSCIHIHPHTGSDLSLQDGETPFLRSARIMRHLRAATDSKNPGKIDEKGRSRMINLINLNSRSRMIDLNSRSRMINLNSRSRMIDLNSRSRMINLNSRSRKIKLICRSCMMDPICPALHFEC